MDKPKRIQKTIRHKLKEAKKNQPIKVIHLWSNIFHWIFFSTESEEEESEVPIVVEAKEVDAQDDEEDTMKNSNSEDENVESEKWHVMSSHMADKKNIFGDGVTL